MDESKLTLCNICLNVKTDETFRVIEKTTKDVLDILLLKGPIEINISLICNACWTKVFEAFRFKTICIDTEDCVFPYVESKNGAPVDLKEIYLKERGEEQLRSVLEEERICRLCMQIVTSGFTSVKDIEMDLIRICIPEVNFNSTEQPVVCTACLESLKIYGSFLGSCFNVQTFQNICEDVVEEDQFDIKSEEIAIKSEQSHGGTATLVADEPTDSKSKATEDLRSLKAQKYEYNTCAYQSDQELQFMQDQRQQKNICVHTYQCKVCIFNTKSEEELMSHQLIHKKIFGVQMYKCDVCTFKTEYKRNLLSHQLIHKSSSEVQMFKCDVCNWETKRKKNLIRHQLVHKDTTEVQMYKCDVCTFQTKYKGYLTKHQLIHKKYPDMQMYKCDTCNYAGRHIQNLTRHKRKHDISEVPMYKCEECNYETKNKFYFKNHQLKHKNISDAQVYRCDLCKYRTKYKNKLLYHKRKHKKISVAKA